MLIGDRHSFVKLKRSVLLIQRAARTWINQRRHGGSIVIGDVSAFDLVNAATVAQKSSCGWSAGFESVHEVAQLEKPSYFCKEKGASDLKTKAVVKIQLAWKNFIIGRSLCNQHFAATKIQSHFLGWLSRRRFLNQRQATIKIQSNFRMKRCCSAYQHYKIATISATLIQSFVRGWIARRGACRCRHLIVAIQVRLWDFVVFICCKYLLFLLMYFGLHFLYAVRFFIHDISINAVLF
jgi:abnormal spindle-like microcephaly-associated protein